MRGPKDVPAEAALIRERREAAIPRMSHRAAAARAETLSGMKFSAATWQKIENGDYRGGADRVAVMALTVGASPDELEEAGRPDAARLFREEIQRRAKSEPALAPVERETTSEAVLAVLLRGLEEIRGERRLNDDQKRRLEESLLSSVLENIEGRIEQIRTTLDIKDDTER